MPDNWPSLGYPGIRGETPKKVPKVPKVPKSAKRDTKNRARQRALQKKSANKSANKSAKPDHRGSWSFYALGPCVGLLSFFRVSPA